MNHKIILNLSLFGFVLGSANIMGLPGENEWIFWFVFLIIASFILVRFVKENLFQNSFLTGFAFAFIIFSIQALFVGQYLENNREFAERAKNFPDGLSARTFFISIGLLIAVGYGGMMGAVSLGLKKFLKNSRK